MPLQSTSLFCRAYLSAQVLADSRHVDSGGGADAAVAGHTNLQVPVDTAYRELQASARGARLGGTLLLIGCSALASLASLAAFAAFLLARERMEERSQVS